MRKRHSQPQKSKTTQALGPAQLAHVSGGIEDGKIDRRSGSIIIDDPDDGSGT